MPGIYSSAPKRIYTIGLALIIAMASLQFVGNRFLAAEQEVASVEINLSGRQRMLSQRIALTVEQIKQIDPEIEGTQAQFLRDTLDACSNLMVQSHTALRGRDVSQMRRALDSGGFCLNLDTGEFDRGETLMLDRSDAPLLMDFVTNVRAIANGEIDPSDVAGMLDPRGALTDFLAQLDQDTRAAQETSIAEIKTYLAVNWALLVLLIVGVGVFLFQPMARRIDASIRQLRQTNAKLRLSEKRLQDFASTAAHQFWETDDKHCFISLGSVGKVSRIQNEGRFLGKPRWDVAAVASEGDPETINWSAHQQVLASRRPFENFEYPVTLLDGTKQWWRVHGRPMLNDAGNFIGYRGTSLEITEEKNARLKNRQSERMAALGQLTAGVAHDFNNLLSVIQGNAELIEVEAELEVRRRNVQEIVAAVEHGATLTNRLLAFGRVQKLKAETISIGSFFADIAPLLQRTLGGSFTVDVEIPDPDILVYVDRHQLVDAFLNISLNARDAAGAGGNLVVSAALCENLMQLQKEGAPITFDDLICISFQDNGRGISAADMTRIFEPFYTTKKVGEGSGLGLSMVYGFALQSGGFVDVSSKVRRGTTMRLYLPVTDQALALPLDDDDEKHQGQVFAQRALLVEDNDELRRVVRRMLETIGFSVTEASDGAAAKTALQGDVGFDCLVVDMVLPGAMSGVDVASFVRQKLPSIAVLFTTGYADQKIIIERYGTLPEPLLEKPFRMDDLARKIEIAMTHCELKTEQANVQLRI